jgi:putative transcriptional regulator
MPFCYNSLWKMLIDKKMTRVQLTKAIGVSSTTMAKMGKDENVSLEVIDRICRLFQCQLSDVIEYVPDEQAEK